jgi:cytochrome c peroxidase
VNRFNVLAIITALLLFSAIALWPTVNDRHAQPLNQNSLLTDAYLGDGSHAIEPIPVDLNLDSGKVKLGKRLFSDPILSGNGFACSTCHPVDEFGVDGLKFSIKTGGGFDSINTPTVFNSGFNALQLWNGKAQSLEEQLDGVINNPLHMASSWQQVLQRLKQSAQYVEAFAALYPEGITQSSVSNAISTYERSLTTPGAPFDRFLLGDKHAITDDQRKGFELFQQYGCISCHQGVNIGGNLLARFGIFENTLAKREQLTDFDYGRFSFTGDPRDKFVFRVPSLRNVAETAPYFHDGSAQTLGEAIRIMARIQLDIDLPDQDIELIDKFLHSLTGIPGDASI